MAKNSSATANSQVDKATPIAQAAKANISPEKKKALDAIMQKIEKDHGKGSIMRLGDATNMRVETIPSGALPLDLALVVDCPKDGLSKSTGQKAQVKLP